VVPATSATVEPGEAEEEPRCAEQRDDGDHVGGPREHQARRESRHQRGRHPSRGEDQIGRRAEQPARIVGDHRFLAQEPGEIAVRLRHRRADLALQAGPDLADIARQKRRQRDHEPHLRQL
jgi:hypothetical protein